MSVYEKLRLLCPRHKHSGQARVGFRCICVELNQAFALGIKAVRRRRL